MSNCIKDLFDYNFVKKCGKCGIKSLNSNFPTDKTTNDGLKPNCTVCRKQNYNEIRETAEKYYLINRDKLLNRIKGNQLKNHDKIIAHKKFILVIGTRQISFFV